MLGPINFVQYLLIAVVFVPLELLLPLHAEQKLLRRHWGNDLVNLLCNAVLIPLGLLAAVSAMLWAIGLTVPHGVGEAVRAQPLWLQAAEAILIADIGFYLAHRAFHAVPFLWKFHAVHHSIEELDWLAAYRVHPIDQILTKSLSLLPVFALGFSDAAVVIFAVTYQWQSIAIHSNNRLGLGPLKWIFATPQFHHWHHANEPGALDKNFAGQLVFLDWIGGTLHMPEGTPSRYGTDEPVPKRYDGLVLYPFRANLARLTGRRQDAGAEV
jgi:sterol desaturase/sphingolipid hydroxylase (fatty acid hydroxylase superfamily)